MANRCHWRTLAPLLSAELMRIAKKFQYLAVAALLLIPVVTIIGMIIAIVINPEIAAGHAGYVSVFRLLSWVKVLFIWGSFLAAFCLWLACCAFVLKARERSLWWLPLAIFGPCGLAVMAALKDLAPNSDDLYQRFIARLHPLMRLAYEITVFFAVWFAAFAAMEVWRYLSILGESMRTGIPVAAIIEVRDASSGMWAFTEGTLVMFLVALFYVAWPIFFNIVGSFGRFYLSWRRA